MLKIGRSATLSFILILLSSCQSSQEGSQEDNGASGTDVSVPEHSVVPMDKDQDLLIKSQPFYPAILLDADGDICNSARIILHKNEQISFVYQRVGCNSDTCKQEIVTYSAIQYPSDAILQQWMADVLGAYYYDVTRELDILVNGEKIAVNADGEQEYQNKGCRPYEGILDDGGKSMFDYYQARVWLIGRDREDVHGPAGRYGSAIYRCWQSSKVVTYFVGYSTEEPQRPVHYVTSFDRKTGSQLSLVDVIKEDCMAEFNDLLLQAEAVRHQQLLKSNKNELAIEPSLGDYSLPSQINSVGFVGEGLAVSTGSLSFDQWATATHILIIPYEQVNDLLVEQYSQR